MKEQILQLRSQGFTYQQIVDKLGCSKSAVCYHCGKGQKDKYLDRQRKLRKKQHPYIKKTRAFLDSKPTSITNKPITHKSQKLIQLKIEMFCRDRKTMKYQKPEFTYEDVIKKFSDNPKCYITGKPIDINKPRTYHFDHIKPVSKGGDNSLDNLGICTKRANLAKTDMTYDEFIAFCKLVINHYENS